MNNLQKYIINQNGVTESIVNIQLLETIKSFDIKILLKNYRISNLFKGKFFTKRLINKIFKYKLNSKMQWSRTFWDKVCVLEIKATIKKTTDFENQNMIPHIKKISSKKRLKDIYYYQTISAKMDPPLYIDGKSLNQIGGDTNPNVVFILDGSRRLIANLLNKKKYISIYLITIND